MRFILHAVILTSNSVFSCHEILPHDFLKNNVKAILSFWLYRSRRWARLIRGYNLLPSSLTNPLWNMTFFYLATGDRTYKTCMGAGHIISLVLLVILSLTLGCFTYTDQYFAEDSERAVCRFPEWSLHLSPLWALLHNNSHLHCLWLQPPIFDRGNCQILPGSSLFCL